MAVAADATSSRAMVSIVGSRTEGAIKLQNAELIQ